MRSQIDRADHVDIMQKKRLVEMPESSRKNQRGLLQPAAGIEQNLFARDLDPHPEVIVRFQIIEQPCRQSDAH